MPARKGKKPAEKPAVEVAEDKEVESQRAEEAVTPPKKGRGREKQKPAEVVEEKEPEVVDEPKAEAKKGRGRPKRSEEENGAANPTGKAAPKPRGRQAKGKVDESKAEEEKDEEPEVSVVDVPRKRGRVQKTRPNIKETAPAVPKKRGRPAKEKKTAEEDGQVKVSVEH